MNKKEIKKILDKHLQKAEEQFKLAQNEWDSSYSDIDGWIKSMIAGVKVEVIKKLKKIMEKTKRNKENDIRLPRMLFS